MKHNWNAITENIKSAAACSQGAVGLFPHIGADADALGSCLALASGLKKLGINCLVIAEEKPSHSLSFIPQVESVDVVDKNTIPHLDLAITIDCTEPSRLGLRQNLFEQTPQKATIDHHLVEPQDGIAAIIDSSAAATAELVYELLRVLEIETQSVLFDTATAEQLLVAIMGDTGRFAFSNTTANTFRIVAELMQYNPRLYDLVTCQFMTNSLTRTRLLGQVLSEAKILANGRLAVSGLSLQALRKHGATSSDIETFAGELRKIEGVMVALFLREEPDGSVRINIRSEVGFNSATLARKFGGGGHTCAAGATLQQNLNEAMKNVVNAALLQFED